MIKIESTYIFGWDAAVRGMRNPLNSWNKSDSFWCNLECDECPERGNHCQGHNYFDYVVGDNDLTLMKKLVKAGSDHAKYLRMINVSLDLTAPLYFWKQFDQYKVGVTTNSCSTMHKIADKKFTMDDFSHEHLIEYVGEDDWTSPVHNLDNLIYCLNKCRENFIETKDKKYWWQMIQLLPSSYNQRRTVQLNYAVLRNMYHARKNHKLDEWRTFCEWVETLPYSELITMD